MKNILLNANNKRFTLLTEFCVKTIIIENTNK